MAAAAAAAAMIEAASSPLAGVGYPLSLTSPFVFSPWARAAGGACGVGCCWYALNCSS